MENKSDNGLILTIETSVSTARIGETLQITLTLRNRQDKGVTIFQHDDISRKPYVISVQDAEGVELTALNTKPIPRSRGMKTKKIYMEPFGVHKYHDTLLVTDHWLKMPGIGAIGMTRFLAATFSVSHSDAGIANETTLLHAQSKPIEVVANKDR